MNSNTDAASSTSSVNTCLICQDHAASVKLHGFSGDNANFRATTPPSLHRTCADCAEKLVFQNSSGRLAIPTCPFCREAVNPQPVLRQIANERPVYRGQNTTALAPMVEDVLQEREAISRLSRGERAAVIQLNRSEAALASDVRDFLNRPNINEPTAQTLLELLELLEANQGTTR